VFWFQRSKCNGSNASVMVPTIQCNGSIIRYLFRIPPLRCSHADARAPHDRDRDRRKVKWREMTQEQRFKVLENHLTSCEKVLRLLKKSTFLRRARPISRLFLEKPSETEFRKPEITRLRLKTGHFGLISVSSLSSRFLN
jgi:hypothetical protein